MSEFKWNSELTKLLDDEMAKWQTQLNRIVAPILVAISGTFVFLVESSPYYAIFLSVFASALIIHTTRDFPRKVQELRDKKNKTVREKRILMRINWYLFLRGRRIRSFFPYWLGLLFTAFVVSKPLWYWLPS